MPKEIDVEKGKFFYLFSNEEYEKLSDHIVLFIKQLIQKTAHWPREFYSLVPVHNCSCAAESHGSIKKTKQKTLLLSLPGDFLSIGVK